MRLSQRRKITLIIINFLLLAILILLQISNITAIRDTRTYLANSLYDTLLRINIHYKAPTKSAIIIADIDEKSLRAEGRWPWPRDKIATLVEKIHQLGSVVAATDIVFDQPEQNMVKAVLSKAQLTKPSDTKLNAHLQQLSPLFDYDQMFANVLQKNDTVLGFIFDYDKTPSTGELPPPILILDPATAAKLVVPIFPSYRGNLPLLQKAAKYGGFITTIPDNDGILRRSPLLIRYNNALYPSLALAAVQRYLLLDKIKINFINLDKIIGVESIDLGGTHINTDRQGQLIIPFSGHPKSFKYVSATDILHDQLPPQALQNTIVFIGTSALGLSDIHATPIAATFPGVEIQATIAAALLRDQVPYRPAWAEGAELLLTIVFGIILALLSPFLGAIALIFALIILVFFLLAMAFWFWQHFAWILSPVIPLLLVVSLIFTNLFYGYLFEYRQRKQLKSIFGQYIPPERVETISEEKGHSSLAGESKELSVLFADIRGFTTISEQLTATQVKELLNRFFTPMTEIIFKHRGTIDKYIGDMIMAFWGAPIADPAHAEHALDAALEMSAKVEELKKEFVELQLPAIDIGIGIHTGIMDVGDMGSKYRLAYTVLGDAVNLGARLEGLTRFYQVRITVSEATRNELQQFVFRRLDRVRVKGKKEAINIYELICHKDELTPEIAREIQQHEQALDFYFKQQWDEAEKIFSQLAEQYPNKGIYHVYLERINHLRKKSLPKDWDGSYVWTKK